MVVKNEKPTVIVVDNSIDITGAFNAIFSFIQFAKAHYNFVFVLPVKSRVTEKIKAHGFVVETLPFLEINKNLFNLIFYFPRLLLNGIRLNRLVRQYDGRLVHVNDFYNLVGVMGKILGGHFSIITHVRFMPNRFPALLVTMWMRCNLQYAKAIICVSQAVKHCLPDHPKIQVIYDGLYNTAPATTITLQAKSHQQETINLLYLAHYIRGKGQDLALEAFYIAFCRNRNLRMRFVGGDMGLEKNRIYLQQLKNITNAKGLTNAVTFDGPSYDVQKDILAADIILNFSESESFSMVCLETLMLGKPLIATDCGGPAELFVHKKSGWLVPNKNIIAMSEAILQLSENQKLREQFHIESANYVKNKFSTENSFQVLNDLYNSLCPR